MSIEEERLVRQQCPQCGADLVMGYGLAGGGIGPYLYCDDCGEYFDKFQDPDAVARADDRRSLTFNPASRGVEYK
jgi:hypothetical protein